LRACAHVCETQGGARTRRPSWRWAGHTITRVGVKGGL
jgi:hypothetical protein